MTFQLKDFRSIAAAMINHAKATQDQITDFHVGSVARTLFESPAIEIDEFYQQVFHGLLDAIPVAIYKAFNFDRLPSAAASGFVTFKAVAQHSTISIPVGTVIERSDVPDMLYFTIENAVIPANRQSVTVRVIAEKTGIDGNADVNVLTKPQRAISGIDSITNEHPISGGREEETDSERELRFLEYIQSLSRGTVAAVVYAASMATVEDTSGNVIEYVTRIGFDEGAGDFTIHLWGSGGIPSDNLIKRCQKIIDGGYDMETGNIIAGYRGAGISCSVVAMTPSSVDLQATVSVIDESYATEETIDMFRSIIDAKLSEIRPGAFLTINELRADLLDIPGVKRIVFSNDSNIECAVNHVLSLGEIEITWA